MKLYLASHQIPNVDVLRSLINSAAGEAPKVAYIPNAGGGGKSVTALKWLTNLGFHPATIDLSNYWAQPAALAAVLSKCDLIWAGGGDPHTLTNAMWDCGFNTIINDLLDAGIVYGGSSAGSMVAGATLKGIPTKLKVRPTLDLVHKFILPHGNQRHKPGAIKYLHNMYENNDNLLMIEDSQAWVVDGDTSTMIHKPLKVKGVKNVQPDVDSLPGL